MFWSFFGDDSTKLRTKKEKNVVGLHRWKIVLDQIFIQNLISNFIKLIPT